MRALALMLSLLAATAAADVLDAEREINAIFDGATRVNGVFVGVTPVFDQAPPRGVAATISDWGATSGTQKQRRLTINRTAITSQGLVIRMSATLTGASSWEVWRDYGTGSSIVAEGTNLAPAYNESLTPDLHPPASGWTYRLHAYASDADGADADDTLTVRVVTAPTLTAFNASAPVGVSAPSINRQCSWLTWTGTEGDPVSTWSMTQAGRRIATLPSSRHLSAAQGRATGLNRTRVCVNAGGGLVTTLTLGARNEAGNVSMQATITWAGG